ncbi:MAG: glutamine--fructose-6-phosphate transaminase (isomerizing) [Candidatus Marinimicrobia bacterium]|nr:glutamine--fructose-6-phosphate transaminase (isomerizing) [Candidatus Neomarinimicrobiota bacterium]
MCGIVGYVGNKNGIPIVMNGLRRLEYRGYDSAGIAVQSNGKLIISKHKGKMEVLDRAIIKSKLTGNVVIGHTRWATHGAPNKLNAHPHLSSSKNIALVHNGIVENYHSLRTFLKKKKFSFKTETDTEVLVNLIEFFYKGNLEEAVAKAVNKVVGAYAISVIANDNPGKIIAARFGPPLIIGLGENEQYVASDVAAILEFTKDVIYLDDGEIAIVTGSGVKIIDKNNLPVDKEITQILWDLDKIEKGGYKHFMLKEIHEQSDTIRDSIRGRFDVANGTALLGGLRDFLPQILAASNLYITACGTSYHAAMIGENLIESLAGIPAEVEYASEFRYKDPIIDEETVVIAISQSGETADTLAAVKMAKKKGATVLGICNVVSSSIARETDGGVYIHAGPEIGVASTKAFTAQVAVLTLLAQALGRLTGMSLAEGKIFVKDMNSIPDLAKIVLDSSDHIKKIARKFKNADNFLYLGRGFNYPVALEGALKLKEISYIHAEGYPAAEIKHGPIALIDEKMPVVFIAPQDSTYEKVLSNMEQVKARKGSIIAIATEGDKKIKKIADWVISIPKVKSYLLPIMTVIPLQLLAYHIAVLRGCNVDQPRNLAKSVTVE